MEKRDLEHLKWIYEEVTAHVNPSTVYMIKFRAILNKFDSDNSKMSVELCKHPELLDFIQIRDETILELENKIKELKTFADNRNNRANGLKADLKIAKSEAKLVANCREKIEKEFAAERERCWFWEKTAKKHDENQKYYQVELEKAHVLIDRIIHQCSERWDTVNLGKYFPTNNLWEKRTHNNPSGKDFTRKIWGKMKKSKNFLSAVRALLEFKVEGSTVLDRLAVAYEKVVAGPDFEDGPWAAGWAERCGKKPKKKRICDHWDAGWCFDPRAKKFGYDITGCPGSNQCKIMKLKGGVDYEIFD